ncbi:hypothetical protein CEXT_177861 [Caerostris extrusa]|uniref:Uncharacterized protein n=1 Tax=Caerostris extrusa TaxID=172846 RepID=A0AAV4WAA5_CAEEX|nr:hypothetical protein CEXT_177861 [Caerostris extrusa]
MCHFTICCISAAVAAIYIFIRNKNSALSFDKIGTTTFILSLFKLFFSLQTPVSMIRERKFVYSLKRPPTKLRNDFRIALLTLLLYLITRDGHLNESEDPGDLLRENSFQKKQFVGR